MTHKLFIKSLTAEQRAQLTRKTNAAGLVRVFIWLSITSVLIMLIQLKVTLWPLLMLPLGLMLVFLFTLMHETTHQTAFLTPRLNSFIAIVCGLVILLPPIWFKAFHFAHHRHTQDKEKDPEKFYPKPDSFAQYLKAVSGVPVIFSLSAKLLNNALGRCADDYVPDEDKHLIRIESQCMLAFYLAAGVASFWAGSYLLLTSWVLPLFLGQPFLRIFLLAEHNECQTSDNMFENTRTTQTNSFIKLLSWNMSYHTEHHVLPSVPFHQLPAFHAMTFPHLKVLQNGYWNYHISLIKRLRSKQL